MGFTFVSGDRRPLPIFSRQKLEKKSFTESNMLRKLFFFDNDPRHPLTDFLDLSLTFVD
jgi:hypothetical protein